MFLASLNYFANPKFSKIIFFLSVITVKKLFLGIKLGTPLPF
jgi:hypothetical protein